MRITKLFLAICLVFAGRMAPADAAVRYFDVNDTAPESGVANDQIYTWDTAALNWNPVVDGSGTAVAWVNGDDAVFSAGSDAVGSLYGLNITAGTTATSALLEDGALTVLSGAIDTGTGTFTVGTGVGSTAVFQVDASPTLRTNGGGILQLHGGTYRMVTNQTVAHSFLPAGKSLEINVEGTIDHQELGTVGAGRIAIYQPTGTNTILGTGGTTTNGGAGTLNITGVSGEIRFNGTGLQLTTYAKLKVGTGMLFRLGNAASIADERGFGAVPLAPLADAITLDGGAIGTSFGVTLHANRGITLGAGGGWFNNSAATMTVPGIISGPGSLNKDVDPLGIKGTATAAGTLNLTSATGNTYAGGSNINAGTVRIFNTSGSGTGTGPVTMGGSSGTQFGTFGGTGIVSGLTTLNQFGEIRPGGTLSTDNAGTLTLNGGLTLNAGSLLTYQMGPTGNDSMVIGGVNGLNIAGPMNMTILANGTIVAPGQFPVLDYNTSFVGSISDITLNTTALAAGFTYSLVNNPTNTSIDFVITGAGPVGVAGDYNNNGTVDAADYVLWRNGGPLQNEVDTPGTVNAADYDAWKARFGNVAGSGSSVNGGAVPEPTSFALISLCVAGLVGFTRRGR